MSIIQEVAPFHEGIYAIKATHPEVYIKYRFEINKPGYIKTATLDLLVFKFTYDNRPTVYIIKDMNGEEVYDVVDVHSNVKFYTIGDNVIVRSSCSVLIYKDGENILRKLTNFQNSMFNIPDLHEYEKSLYYMNNCISNYKTLVVFVDNMFYRICYNTKEYFIVGHLDKESYVRGVFECSQLVTVNPDLSYLFDDLQSLTKEKFAEYCQIIDVDSNYELDVYNNPISKAGKFTNLPRALLYVKYYKRMSELNETANIDVIVTIDERIKEWNGISKNTLKEHAELFV